MRVILYALLLLVIGAPSVTPQPAKAQRVPIDAGKSAYFLLNCPANHKAQLQVNSDKAGDVDLFVIDPDGKTIASDTSVGKDCKIAFTTKEKPLVCVVKIANLGPSDNVCAFKHNLEAAKLTALEPVEIAAGKKVSFYRKYRDSGIARVQAEAGEVSIYSLDNVKIASGAKAFWRLDAPAIYRVTIANPSKEKIVAKLSEGDYHWMLFPTKESPAFDLAHDAKKTLHYDFEANKIAVVMVNSDKETDIDLMVYDKAGKEVVSDITIGKDCFVAWMPTATATYRVVVVNRGVGSNRCVLKHNGDAR